MFSRFSTALIAFAERHGEVIKDSQAALSSHLGTLSRWWPYDLRQDEHFCADVHACRMRQLIDSGYRAPTFA